MKARAWWWLLTGLLAAAMISHQGSLLAFAFVLALASGASALWARTCLNGVTFQRSLSEHYLEYGEEAELTLEITNAKPLPLAWLLVRDQFPRQVTLLSGDVMQGPNYRPAELSTLVSLRWYERVRRTHRIRATQRGLYRFGPAQIISGDMFGFRRRERREDEFETLTVYPKIVPLVTLGLPTGRPMGDWLARRRIVEDPLRYSGVREYRAGDSPRHVHWIATARTLRMQTKVFDPSDTLTVVIALDVQTRPHNYEYIPDHLEYAICAAASIATEAIQQRHPVGLCANALSRGGTAWTQVRPGRHSRQHQRILAELAALLPYRGLDFDALLLAVRPQLPLGATIVAITASPDEGVYGGLAALQRAGHPVLLLTIGDEPPEEMPRHLPSHHLGGRDAWQRLQALELD